MEITIENPRSTDIVALLQEHFTEMRSVSRPESCHVLDIDELDQPAITFWAAREGGALLGVGALKVHNDGTGEVKSMRTATSARGRGVGAAVLTAITDAARERGLSALNLETGAEDHFAPARALYERYGFHRRGPFADYIDDPHSVYFGLELNAESD